ncbi:hypothetical protein IHE45_10G038800 [Dioscorea alata]|uniref:Uncharacterized protein n=1 Tax=Dioscorea alata TaxID=55571 RepID=A0ACB7VAI5_DIOAL|nr:hypothetical protein IHE45_10G038800 [Dioscorea alata]
MVVQAQYPLNLISIARHGSAPDKSINQTAEICIGGSMLPITARAIFEYSLALRLISYTSSPKLITILIATATSSAPTNTVGSHNSPLTRTLSLTTLFKNFSFTSCLYVSGHVTIGTPAKIPSNVEFHSQCVKNPPIAHPLMSGPFMPTIFSSLAGGGCTESPLIA